MNRFLDVGHKLCSCGAWILCPRIQLCCGLPCWETNSMLSWLQQGYIPLPPSLFWHFDRCWIPENFRRFGRLLGRYVTNRGQTTGLQAGPKSFFGGIPKDGVLGLPLGFQSNRKERGSKKKDRFEATRREHQATKPPNHRTTKPSQTKPNHINPPIQTNPN